LNYYGEPLNRLIEQLAKLPGIGSKSAQKLAFHIINMPSENVDLLANSMKDAKNKIKYCKFCCTITDSEICPICNSTKRDHSTIMIVEDTRDLVAYERTKEFKGVYHVLHGAISPMLGIGPSDIKIKELLQRIKTDDIKEVILATNANIEGN